MRDGTDTDGQRQGRTDGWRGGTEMDGWKGMPERCTDRELDERTGGTDGKVERRDRQTKRRVGKMDGWTHVWRPTDGDR